MNIRPLAYPVAILFWLGIIYAAAHAANSIADSIISVLGTFSLGGLTLLVLDSIRRTRRKIHCASMRAVRKPRSNGQ